MHCLRHSRLPPDNASTCTIGAVLGRALVNGGQSGDSIRTIDVTNSDDHIRVMFVSRARTGMTFNRFFWFGARIVLMVSLPQVVAIIFGQRARSYALRARKLRPFVVDCNVLGPGANGAVARAFATVMRGADLCLSHRSIFAALRVATPYSEHMRDINRTNGKTMEPNMHCDQPTGWAHHQIETANPHIRLTEHRLLTKKCEWELSCKNVYIPASDSPWERWRTNASTKQ